MPVRFERVLLDAVALLRDLPRGRHDVADVKARVRRFREMHPSVRADLVVDNNPALVEVDYDLLLGDPAGGTVALSWCNDDKAPWFVAYGNHWAANCVVSVNKRHVTAQSVLLHLKGLGPDLARAMVNQQLLEEAVDESSPDVTQEEIQAAADEFRQARGLFTAAATERWLDEMGYSAREFTEIATESAKTRKLKDRITADQIRPRFKAQRSDLASIRFFRVYAGTVSVARRVAASARKQGLFRAIQSLLRKPEGQSLEASLQSARSFDLPKELSAAEPGAIVGPVADESRFWVAEVLERRPATLDEEMRTHIRTQLFNDWLAERRENATVQWHWM